MVRNLSEAGARLRIAASVPLPKSFQLILRCHEVEVAWRRGREVDVRFVGNIDLSDVTNASVRLLRLLWAEIAGRAAGIRTAEYE